MEKPLVDRAAVIEKFPGKGGWSFVDVPEIEPDRKAPFGWIKVRGSIDGYVFNGLRLMPKGNGRLFLPLKFAIRKHILKQAGDHVHLLDYKDDRPLEIPESFLSCLRDAPDAHIRFFELSEGKQKAILDDIFSAKTDATKVARIVRHIEQLSNNETD